MALSVNDLVRDFGAHALRGNGAVFVGAGLSRGCGYPDWGELLEEPRKAANIPADITDLPLVAEYIARSQPGGRDALIGHLLETLRKVSSAPGVGHTLLRRLPVTELWTTNYDNLIEDAGPGLSVIVGDDDLRARRGEAVRLVKMHGSLAPTGQSGWASLPVLTRSDYETYERLHLRTWAALRATYLTKSLLFLGFSFDDPNVEVLLRLARTIGDLTSPEHFTVIRRPTDPSKLREHELRVDDLQSSGIAVSEIAEYDDLIPLLRSLVRRTRPPAIYISGNSTDIPTARALGQRLADVPQAQLKSLAGPAALNVSFGFGDAREASGQYEAADVEFYFRARNNEKSVPLPQRTGTAIHTGLDTEALRDHVIDESRACAVLGGGTGTKDEIDRALGFGLPVVPLPSTGGTARDVYESASGDPARLLLRPLSEEDRRDWDNLAHTDTTIGVRAAASLLARLAYLVQ